MNAVFSCSIFVVLLLCFLLPGLAAFLVAYKPKKGRSSVISVSFHYVSIFLVIA